MERVALRSPGAVTRGQWFINHPRYPVLMPVSQVEVLEATAAGQDEFPFRAVYAAFFPALLMLLYDGVRRWTGRLSAAVTVTAACGLRFLTFCADGGAMSSYSDLPLGVFLGTGLIRLLLKGARLCAAASVILAAVAFFIYWRTVIPNRQDENYEELVQLESLAREVVVRLPLLVSRALDKTFLTWDHWMGFWWVFAIVLIAGRSVLRGRRAALTRPLALAAAAPMFAGWGAYSAIGGPEWLIEVTWERFLVQAMLPLLLLFAAALGELLQRSPFALKLARLSQ